MLEFGSFWRWFAHLFERWPPGVPPDPKKCENVSIFYQKTNIFQIKNAGIPSCFLNIFGKKTNDTVQKNQVEHDFSGAKKASSSFCFLQFWARKPQAQYNKKGQHSVLFFKHLWGDNRRHSTQKQVGGYFPVEKGVHAVLFFWADF